MTTASGDIPFEPECEMTTENGPSLPELKSVCPKNPGHKGFISVSDFKMNHLPLEYQCPKLMDCIKFECDLTVKIIAPYISPKRPKTYYNSETKYPYGEFGGNDRIIRNGTGTLYAVCPESCFRPDTCSCHLCNQSNRAPVGRHWTFDVVTAAHVIYDDLEAAQVRFECFYDSDSPESKCEVKVLYGVCLTDGNPGDLERCSDDRCMVKCVTHDEDLGKKICDIFKRRGPSGFRKKLSSTGFMISHPHGLAKTISFGEHLCYTLAIDTVNHRPRSHKFKREVKCRLPAALQDNEHYEEGTNYKDHYVIDDDYVAMAPGVEFPLPVGLTFTLPKDTKHEFQFHNEITKWYTFPRGTQFSFPGKKEVVFPSHTEFGPMDSSHFITLSNVTNDTHITYNIPCCPGSSGAAIHDLHEEFTHRFPSHTHAGALLKGNNRSGMGCLFVSNQF